jgi:hypothetical protein
MTEFTQISDLVPSRAEMLSMYANQLVASYGPLAAIIRVCADARAGRLSTEEAQQITLKLQSMI